jgi:hypothetical protein
VQLGRDRSGRLKEEKRNMSKYYYQYAKNILGPDHNNYAGWMVFDHEFVEDETGEPIPIALCANRAAAAEKRDALNAEYARAIAEALAEADRAIEADRKRAAFKIIKP